MTSGLLEFCEIRKMRSVEKTQLSFVWTTGRCLLLLLGLSTVQGVQIIPGREDGVVDVLSGQNTSFTCKSEGNVQWKLLLPSHNSTQSFLLSNCTENVCQATNFGETFVASVRDYDTKVMTVNAVNNTKIFTNVQVVNGSLQCDVVINRGTNQSLDTVVSASWGMNYVYPPENVKCIAVQTSSSIHVSCNIGSVYSSRKIYKCHLFRGINNYENSSDTVTMVTSPTSEKITKTEVKVSGSCQFNTSLPPDEGLYGFVVSISPGGRNYSVKLIDDGWLTTEPPNDTNMYNIILAGVSGIIVLVVISLVICLIIKKKTKDGRKKESNFTLYEDPTDMVLFTMDVVPAAANTRTQQHCLEGSQQDKMKVPGIKQDLLGADVYDNPWDAVPAQPMMEEMEPGYIQIQESESLRYEMEAGYVQIQDSENLMYNAVNNAKWNPRYDGHPGQDDDRSTEKKNGRKQGTKAKEMLNPYLSAKDLQRIPVDESQENQVFAIKKCAIEGSNDDIVDIPLGGSASVVKHEYMMVGLSPRQLKSALHTNGAHTAVSSETSGARGQTLGDRVVSESSCFPSSHGQEWEDLHVHETVYSLATVMPT